MKRIKKILVTVCALIMALGTTMASYAATPATTVSVARIKKITVTQASNNKSAGKITAYSNGIKNETLKVTYTWDNVTQKKDGQTIKTTVAPSEVRVASADRGVVNVEAALANLKTEEGTKKEKTSKGVTTTTVPMTVTGEIVYTPAANGKTTVTIAENTSLKGKKAAKVNMTVLTMADHIEFGSNVGDSKGEPAVKIARIAKGGKLGLEASACKEDSSKKNVASNQKVKYEIASVTELQSDGAHHVENTTIKLRDEKGAINNNNKRMISQYASVDGKGNVSVKNGPKNGAYENFALAVKVTSADGNANDVVYVVSQSTAEKNAAIKVIPDDAASTKAVLGIVNKKNVLTMKGNRSSSARTYQINFKTEGGLNKEDVRFTSSNTAVATVDQKGKVTAVGNGKAVITLDSKYGAKVKTAKVTVNAATDPEAVTVAGTYFEILANGKDAAKIAGAVDSSAANKKVKYDIVSVTDGTNTYSNGTKQDKNEIRRYASVDAKGNAKIKKACVATINVYAEKHPEISTTVTVKGVTPVDKLVVKSAVDQSKNGISSIDTSDKKKTKTTLSIHDKDGRDSIALVYTATDKSGNELKDTEVTVTVDKQQIVDVKNEDGKLTVIPMRNGKANITVAAADGSGKKTKFAVEVKTDAYKIDIAKAQNDADNLVVYVKGDATKAKSYNLAKEIAAATNADASVKGVRYFATSDYAEKKDQASELKQVSLKAGESSVIMAAAKDQRTHGEVTEGAAAQKVILKCISEEQIASQDDIRIVCRYGGYTDRALIGDLQVGKSTNLCASVEVKDNVKDKYVTDQTALTYASSNKAVAAVAKDGTITAKKPGETVMTIAYKQGKNVLAEKTVKVVVGRNDADVQKDISNTITASLKAENRDYTGIHTEYDAKTKSFKLSIIDPEKEFRSIKNTGLVTALKDVVAGSEIEYEYVWIDAWCIRRKGDLLTIEADGNEKYATKDIFDAIDYVFEHVDTITNKETLQEWNGYETEICLGVFASVPYTGWNEETGDWTGGQMNKEYFYEVSFAVAAEMDENLYKGQIDDAISKHLTTLSVDGVKEISYDAAKNTAAVTAADAAQNIAKADAVARDNVVEALQKVLSDAKEVRLGYTIPGKGKDTITKTRGEEDDQTYINSLIDDYLAKLANNNVVTYGDLDGSVVTADVTFEVGFKTYSQTYVMTMSLDESAFDNAADKAILDAVGDGKLVFGDVAYDADANALKVDFNAEYSKKAPIDLASTGLKNICNAMIDNTGVDRTAKVTVIRDGKGSQVDIAVGSEILVAAITGNADKVADLNGDEVIVKVTYKSANGKTAMVLCYEISFTAVVESEETEAQEAVSENSTGEDEIPAEETPAEDEIPAEETPAEEETPVEEETPAEDETPVEEETPVEDETPAEEPPVEDETPAEETPAETEAEAAEETPVAAEEM